MDDNNPLHTNNANVVKIDVSFDLHRTWRIGKISKYQNKNKDNNDDDEERKKKIIMANAPTALKQMHATDNLSLSMHTKRYKKIFELFFFAWNKNAF